MRMLIERLKLYLSHNVFLKNIIILTSGSIIAQGITFVSTILLSHLYSPSTFGELSIFTSILSFFVLFSTGKYDLAIVVSSTDNEARVLIRICNIILFFVFALSIAFLITYFSLKRFGLIENKEITFLYLLPISLLLLSSNQIIQMYFVRNRQFGIINYSRIFESISNGVFSAILSLYTVYGLIIGYLIGQFAGWIPLFSLFRKKKYRSNITKDELILVGKKYNEFPKVNVLQGLLDMMQFGGIVLLLSIHFDNYTIGLYSLSTRLLQAPMGLVIKPITNVFFSEASGRYQNNNNNYYNLIKSTLIKSSLVLTPIILTIALVSPYLFKFFFGEEWIETSAFVQIFSTFILFDMLRSVISHSNNIIGKQRSYFIWSLIWGAGLILIVTIGISPFKNNVFVSFLIISIYQTIQALFLLILTVKMAKNIKINL